ncbi:AEC family transporter [bacterium]|nr:AEC family transporter [bacterium]
MVTVIATLNAILPSFVIMFCGWAIYRLGIVSHRFLQESSRLVFFIALPVMITLKFYEVDASHAFPIRQLIVCFVAAIIFCVMSWLVARKLAGNPDAVGAIFQGATRSNFAVIGLYLVNTLFGHDGLLNATLLMVATIPINNVSSVLILSRYGSHSHKKSGSVFKSIFMNPTLLSLLVVPLIWFKPPVPEFVLHSAHDIASLTLPLALIGVGASIQFSRIRTHMIRGGLTVMMKLVAMPMVVIGVSILAGIRGLDLASITLFSATPTATASYILAKRFQSDIELTSWVIAASTLLSLITLPVIVIVLRVLALIP